MCVYVVCQMFNRSWNICSIKNISRLMWIWLGNQQTKIQNNEFNPNCNYMHFLIKFAASVRNWNERNKPWKLAARMFLLCVCERNVCHRHVCVRGRAYVCARTCVRVSVGERLSSKLSEDQGREWASASAFLFYFWLQLEARGKEKERYCARHFKDINNAT